jgi:hypothetical protein
MSNQIVISSGAKVRSLEGVLTGTAGIVNALGINVANGIPQLDSNAKILVSQLPNSVMEYKGTWNAATNTPTLANGTGNQGDVYLCNVAGTVNFGAGAITFAVGDQVIYSGTIWQKAGGATGTVTSVALTESGDALTITGSPITTSGTINIGFAGTTGQYINGSGGLTTFPSFVSSVGLTSTAPALTITNSPITSSGNIGINFSGNSGQYVSGDGNLVNFPTVVTQAQNLVTEVYNNTGATLTKGTVVYINGGQGNLPTITKAQANTEAASNQTIGLVRADITNNNNGFVTVAGTLIDLNTNAFSTGQTLYLSPSVAGGYTATKPTSPDHIVYVGVVVRAHPTQGVIEVKIQNTQELSESSDVLITSPANNEGLFYDGATSLWKNKTIATALGYTPANDALVVHLAGTQTITGSKTFSNNVRIDNGSASAFLAFKQYSSGSTGTAGFTSIYAINTDTFGISFGAGNDILFKTASPTLPRTYTFPNNSGTVALTSDIPSLSGYVQGSGTTNYIPKFTASGTIGNSSIIDNGTITAYTNAFYVYQTAGTGAAFYMTGGGTDATISSVTSGGANQNLNLMGSTLSLWTGTLGGLAYTERMRISTTGNVGIGTTSTPVKFTIANADTRIEFDQLNSTTSYLEAINTARSTSNFFSMYTRGLNIWTRPSGTGTYAQTMTITDSGNVGIGTSSPNFILQVNKSDGGASVTQYTNADTGTASSNGLLCGIDSGEDGLFFHQGAKALRYGTSDTERMRITSAGDVLVGTTSDTFFNGSNLGVGFFGSNGFIAASRNGGSSAFFNRFTSTGDVVNFRYAGSNVGSISTNGSTVTFSGNALSDERFKENIEPIENALSTICKVEFKTFNYLESKQNSAGVTAQQLQTIEELSKFVIEGIDEKSYKAVDYNAIIGYLGKAIQELKAELDELKNK